MKRIDKNQQRGMSLGPVMIFAMGFLTLGLSVVSLSLSHHRIAKKTTDKWQSTSLAESAIHSFYEQIRAQMLVDGTYPFLMPSTDVTVTSSGTTNSVGTMAATLITHREVQTDENWGGTKVRKYTYYFTIEGTGQATGGVQSTIRSRYKGELYRYLTPVSSYSTTSAPGTFGFPIGAIVSNTTVDIKTDQGLRTYSPSGSDAHVIANTGITWSPPGGKNSLTNPNIMDIQGYMLVPDGSAYSLTNGTSGLGNPNGHTCYRTPAAPASGDFPGAPANSVIKLDSPVSFADTGTVDGWAADWLGQSTATHSTTFSSAVTSTGITPRPGDGKIGIQSPAMINGNLTVAPGGKIELWPSSTDPRKNVVYIKGNVSNMGQLVNHGCTIVFEGKYTDSASAEYKIEPDSATFTDPALATMRSSLLSLNQSKDAFTFSTNSSSNTGLIYALKGGIDVKGSNAEFTGMLLAGGTGTNGGITIEPGGGNSFVVHFDPNSATGGTLALDADSLIDVSYVPADIASNFNASKLTGWVNIK
jgi:Tfp pilus assembly protein PilX